MPQNPVNLDYAIDTLRSETAPPALESRLIRGVTSRKRTQVRTRAMVVACAAVGTAFILWPRAGIGSAWAQTVGQTESAKTVHRISYDRNGKVNYEMWAAPNRQSVYGLKGSGEVEFESRWDGKKLFNYADIGSDRSLPNATRVATVSAMSKSLWARAPHADDFLSAFLKDNKAKVLSQEQVSTPKGPMDRYSVTTPNRGDVEIDAEHSTKRIVEVRSKKYGTVEKIDYPRLIPAEVFEPRPQVVKHVVVHQVDRERTAVRDGLEHGLASKDGIEIRFAGIDSEGNLWVLWTGSIPDGKLSKPFLTPGVAVGQQYGLPTFTNGRATDKMSSISKVVGEPIGGMARPVKVRVGNKVDLEIPSDHGYVRFKQVPVMRMRFLFDFEDMLGFRRA